MRCWTLTKMKVQRWEQMLMDLGERKQVTFTLWCLVSVRASTKAVIVSDCYLMKKLLQLPWIKSSCNEDFGFDSFISTPVIGNVKQLRLAALQRWVSILQSLQCFGTLMEFPPWKVEKPMALFTSHWVLLVNASAMDLACGLQCWPVVPVASIKL